MKAIKIFLAGLCFFSFGVPGAQAANLQLTRIQLHFENKQASITVKKQQPNLKAYAEIHFQGSGLLRGYWQVDGRLIANVNRHVTRDQKLTLATPQKPALPTFSEGAHIVMFMVSQPAQPIAFPKALYYVTPAQAPVAAALDLTQPAAGSEVDPLQTRFQWEKQAKAATYLIEFIDDNPQKPLFSAVTEQSEYVLPGPVLKYSFAKNQSYFWRVKGFDASHTLIGESPVWEWRIK